MSESNKSYRINIGKDNDKKIYLNLEQDYETFDVLSMSISQKDLYKIHSADYGVVVGRVLANGNFGVPNAKISVFIDRDNDFNVIQEIEKLYPYESSYDKNSNGVRYNLLPSESVSDCHQVVGTFPTKTYLLDNDVLMEVFDKYYKFTCRSNNSGDYIICGVPTGYHTIHMDLDISDCGILSQKPRDFIYKGYNIEQFENPNKFKGGTDYNELSQVVSQDMQVDVIPFWGSSDDGENIGLTRADVNVNFKFEPTCVFIGSVVSDGNSNGISKKCVPTEGMGFMDKLTTGEGKIEMIRKNISGEIEEFQIKGTELINSNGVWCYQIPMNLDYMMTDEYGNMVPTDDPEKGIPTRASVRFRISLNDGSNVLSTFSRGKVLVPNYNSYDEKEPDYDFGTYTSDESFRDLLWNYVYTVKSYVPRFQKTKSFRTEKFTGIKHCNNNGSNNPMPYNNIRIKFPFMFTMICSLVKTFIRIATFVNGLIYQIGNIARAIYNHGILKNQMLKVMGKLRYVVISDGLCPEMEGWYFAPGANLNELVLNGKNNNVNIFENTYKSLTEEGYEPDKKSEGVDNVSETEGVCLTNNTDYLISCIEMNLAQQYNVINFDFYNDWFNGVLYIPRFTKYIRRRKTYLFDTIKIKEKVKGCFNDTSIFSSNRRYYQQCSLTYKYSNGNLVTTCNKGCNDQDVLVNKDKEQCHKKNGRRYQNIFKREGGVVNEYPTLRGDYVYYLKPYDKSEDGKRVLMFPTDIVLLGSLKDCDENGVPQFFKYLPGSTYNLPTNLALTTLDSDGYIYASSGGSMCSKEASNNYGNEGITVMEGTFEKEYEATKNTDDEITYDEGDDRIPVTEMAGISWNYTGPDQISETDGKNDIYRPGGHFLGLSCFNSQTNIKSCVNLTRACELGASLSQRNETYIPAKDEGRYLYFVPNGFISYDEIVGVDARSMFATMNSCKLNASRYTDDGRYMYEYSYLRPNGFDGSFSRYAKKGVYNRKVEYNVDTGITLTQEEEDIKDNSYMRSLEFTSKDYLRFRFGTDNVKTRFINNSISDKLSLPQYENSFYFYFGLKEGATAIDEFNRQFFSECEKLNIFGEPSMEVNEHFSIDSGYSLTFETFNFEEKYYKLEYEGNEVGSGNTKDESGKTIDILISEGPGDYKLILIDEEGNTISKSITVGDSFKLEMEMHNSRSNKEIIITSGNNVDDVYRVGGYILLGKKSVIEETEYDLMKSGNSIVIKNIGVLSVERQETESTASTTTTKSPSDLIEVFDDNENIIVFTGTGDFLIKFSNKKSDYIIKKFRINNNENLKLAINGFEINFGKN